jgi:2,3-bisphosphoglycerate-dependent phosphoglycerate mutase
MALTRYFLILIIYTVSITASFSQTDDATTFFFIRHAEKIRDGNTDPDLTEQGKTRSMNWADVFKYEALDAVYSTNTQRTINTAKPTASNHELEIVTYDAETIDIESLAKVYEGKTVLIVGHSNSTPRLVNKLLGHETYPKIEDDNNGYLYGVTIIKGISTSLLLHID